MRGWLNDTWDHAKRNPWFGRASQPRAIDHKAATVEFSPKRVAETAGRLRRELATFIRANGPMPEAASTEDFGALWSWQSRMNGWYEGNIKPVILPLFDQLSERGLTDTVLESAIHQSEQTEESITLISQRLLLLASRL